ncbi:TetR/AcrR family transcriptional regulator [Pacificimonas sp. WHA3]|uniref:TetR/AcrR family transcriptional regulator n=1 Tax=Pacificimonas pallii TaxID=2827236 RepID=A0ABS6SCN7_9SPHN|nr:TetR/AcrR family transcriptional regulator [Pacificimonas pallii]MBV7256184.1 TetR/AcrR family transcriptional regulator [Pacificimonas pallii]
MPIKIRKSRRPPEAVRADAIAAARELLIAEGPQAVTLKAVARALGMTHGNITHHFGSVGGLHRALIGTMTRELTGIVEHLAAELREKRTTPREIVDTVFDAFGPGGATRLIAWVQLSGKPADLAQFHAAVADLVEVLTGEVPGRRKIDSARVTLAVMLPALGHALLAQSIETELGIDDGEVRAQVAMTLGALLRLERMGARQVSAPRRRRLPAEA